MCLFLCRCLLALCFATVQQRTTRRRLDLALAHLARHSREREIWLGGGGSSSLSENDPLVKLLVAAGVGGPGVLRRLCSNPRFAEDGGAPLFDVVEHMDTVACAEALVSRLQREIESETESESSQQR